MTELIFSICGRKQRALLQDGFLSTVTTPRLHAHNYVEIHAVSGDMTVEIGGELHELHASDAIAIPNGVYHRIIPAEGCSRLSFQTDLQIAEVRRVTLADGIVAALLKEARQAHSSRNFAMAAAYLSTVASALADERYEGECQPDYSLSVREFFSRRYGEDVRLSNLADELHLSERQTERLVLLHTGRSFRDELTATRMAVADQLIAEGRLSLSEIAAYVGYRSYAGFYKAIKRRP